MVQRFVYDGTNRMTKAINKKKNTSAIYQYSGLGERVGQAIFEGNLAETLDPTKGLEAGLTPTKRIDYIVDVTKDYHNLLAKEVNGVTQQFVWDSHVLQSDTKGEYSFYFQDDLGSPTGIYGNQGVLEQEYIYDVFGKEQGKATGTFGFTGYQRDEVTNLYFAQARYYQPGNGRFVSDDNIKGFTYDPYTLNEYHYCYSNPNDYVDEDGNLPKPVEKLKKWLVEDVGVGIDVTETEKIESNGTFSYYESTQKTTHIGGKKIVFSSKGVTFNSKRKVKGYNVETSYTPGAKFKGIGYSVKITNRKGDGGTLHVDSDFLKTKMYGGVVRKNKITGIGSRFAFLLGDIEGFYKYKETTDAEITTRVEKGFGIKSDPVVYVTVAVGAIALAFIALPATVVVETIGAIGTIGAAIARFLTNVQVHASDKCPD